MAAYWRGMIEAPPGPNDVFRALADPARRALLEALLARPGQSLNALAANIKLTRQATDKHLRVLERAGLVTSARRGRERLHLLSRGPITALRNGWLAQFAALPDDSG